MKRRNFLASLTGIFAAPFVAKNAIAATPMQYRHAACLIKVGPNFEREVLDRWDSTKESLPAWQERMRKYEAYADYHRAKAKADILGIDRANQ